MRVEFGGGRGKGRFGGSRGLRYCIIYDSTTCTILSTMAYQSARLGERTRYTAALVGLPVKGGVATMGTRIGKRKRNR